MTVKGEWQKKNDKGDLPLHLRTDLASGVINGEKYSVTLNIDNRCLFVEFPDHKEWRKYMTEELVRDAYAQLLKKNGHKKIANDKFLHEPESVRRIDRVD